MLYGWARNEFGPAGRILFLVLPDSVFSLSVFNDGEAGKLSLWPNIQQVDSEAARLLPSSLIVAIKAFP